MEVFTNPRRNIFQWLQTFFFLGLGVYLQEPVHSSICFLLALLPMVTSKGVEFDVANRRYRNFFKVWHWRVGLWERLPSISRVVVKYFSELSTSGRPGRMRTDRDECYIVMLSVENSATGIVVERLPLSAKFEAIALAKDLAAPLGVQVVVADPRAIAQ